MKTVDLHLDSLKREDLKDGADDTWKAVFKYSISATDLDILPTFDQEFNTDLFTAFKYIAGSEFSTMTIIPQFEIQFVFNNHDHIEGKLMKMKIDFKLVKDEPVWTVSFEIIFHSYWDGKHFTETLLSPYVKHKESENGEKPSLVLYPFKLTTIKGNENV